jgi:hypothetical protein
MNVVPALTPAAEKVTFRLDTTWRFAGIDHDVLVLEDHHDRDELEFGGLVINQARRGVNQDG